jgi:hypothetical protein
MATGSDPDKVIDLLNKSGRIRSPIRAARMAGGTKDNIEYAFKYIPLNHGTLAMITFANLDPTTRPKAIGHTVIFAKNASNTPVIYDGTLRSQHVGMDEIMHYLNKQNLLGHLFIPVYQSMIIHRGTKRSSMAVRRGNSPQMDARSKKRARIPESQRKPTIYASAKTKRAYEINRLRIINTHAK